MKTPEPTRWELPDLTEPFSEGPGRSFEDFEKFKSLAPRVIEAAERNSWSKSEVAKRIPMPDSTFSMWVAKKYNIGRYDTQNALVEAWLDTVAAHESLAASIPAPPPFLATEFSNSVFSMLAAAQMLGKMVMVTADAGHGKTFTAERYAATHVSCFLVTMSPATRSNQGMLTEIAAQLDVGNGGTGLVRAIGRRVKPVSGAGSLLIIDEAQELLDECVNQLRHFSDCYKCGIALLGNSETYSRFSKQWSEQVHYGQLRRRIFMRAKPKPLSQKDVRAFIRAWGVTDPGQEAALMGIAQKPGALGQVSQTLTLAKMVAMGAGRPLTLKDIQDAWSNRGVEA